MERLVKYATIISGLLIFLGFINIVTYYGPFGFDVWAYLTPGDLLLGVLPLSFDLIYPVCFALLVLWLTSFDHETSVYDYGKGLVMFLPRATVWVKKTSEHWEKTRGWKRWVIGLLMSIFGLVVYGGIPVLLGWYLVLLAFEAFGGNKLIEGHLLWMMVGLICVPALCFIIYRRSFLPHWDGWKYVSAMTVLTYIVIRIGSENHIEASEVMDGKVFQRVWITTNDGFTYRSTPQEPYIGRCGSAVFYYQCDSSKVRIIPIDRIKDISIQNVKFYNMPEQWLKAYN